MLHTPQAVPAQMPNAIRFLAADAAECAGSGHPGMPMGVADVATVLCTKALKYDAARPNRPDRYIRYGVREHGMAAIMNGLALRGGYRPSAGTIPVFANFLHPSLRLALHDNV